MSSCASCGIWLVDVCSWRTPQTTTPLLSCSRLSSQPLRAHLHLGGGHRLVLGFHRPLLLAGPAEAPGHPKSRRDVWESAHQQLPGVSLSLTGPLSSVFARVWGAAASVADHTEVLVHPVWEQIICSTDKQSSAQITCSCSYRFHKYIFPKTKKTFVRVGLRRHFCCCCCFPAFPKSLRQKCAARPRRRRTSVCSCWGRTARGEPRCTASSLTTSAWS